MNLALGVFFYPSKGAISPGIHSRGMFAPSLHLAAQEMCCASQKYQEKSQKTRDESPQSIPRAGGANESYLEGF